MNGFFNVYKPGGMTSHDVVAIIRRASHQRRVGHAGTLDPAAEGVLLVCMGSATRVSDYLMGGRKRYTATIALGVTTTTDDAEGEVTGRGDASGVDLRDVELALGVMVGRVLQVPPMYSALKVQGKPLYRYARGGVEVERQPRAVDIYGLDVLRWEPPTVVVDVRCGKGTYVRTIARDLGERLGCGAHLAHLVRTASGRFAAADAVPLETLRGELAGGRAEMLLYPPDEALLDLGAIVVGSEGRRRLTTGSVWRPAWIARRPSSSEPQQCRIYSVEGEILAIGEYDVASDHWRPVKSLVAAV